MGMVINRRDALRGLEEAVDERGEDYVYKPPDSSACLNWHIEEDRPGCIVGLALHKLGVSAEVLRKNYTGGIHTLREELAHEGIEITDEATDVFVFAQAVQDQRGNWGGAVAAARAAASRFS